MDAVKRRTMDGADDMDLRSRTAFVLLALCVALSLGPGFAAGARAETAGPGVMATIDRIEGSACVLPAAGGFWEDAKIGRSLRFGDRLRTGADSWATLALPGDGRLVLGPGCEISFDSFLRLRLLIGRLWARIRPILGETESLRVETPSAVVAVRGTSFSASVRPDDTTIVSVMSGQVEVAGAEHVIVVSTGFATRVFPGQRPEPSQPADDEERRGWIEAERRMRGPDGPAESHGQAPGENQEGPRGGDAGGKGPCSDGKA